jgi:hypothetical protein
MVTGVAVGEGDITATYQGVAGRLHVTIRKAEVPTFTLSGTVTDRTSGGVLPNINIQATDSGGNSKSTLTGSSGTYSIAGLAAGSGTLTASAVSYQTTRLTVSLSEDTELDIVLPRTVCTFTLHPSSFSFQSAGGTGAVTLGSQATGCAWAARSNDAFITITSGSAGNDNGTVTFIVAANAGSARSGTLTIAGQTVTVNQTAPDCAYTLSTTSIYFGESGGTATVTVTAPSGCTWMAVSNASLITVTSGASGSGDGGVTIKVFPHVGAGPRTGTLTIAGQTVTVNQWAPCDNMVFPTVVAVPIGGGTFFVIVNAGESCSWTATSYSSFITVTSGASGQGTGKVTFTVAPNPGPNRSGFIWVSPEVSSGVAVNQDGTGPFGVKVKD